MELDGHSILEFEEDKSPRSGWTQRVGFRTISALDEP